jgi:hypothetical protein
MTDIDIQKADMMIGVISQIMKPEQKKVRTLKDISQLDPTLVKAVDRIEMQGRLKTWNDRIQICYYVQGEIKWRWCTRRNAHRVGLATKADV